MPVCLCTDICYLAKQVLQKVGEILGAGEVTNLWFQECSACGVHVLQEMI